MIKENLKRLRPFEGLCVTAQDLSSEQQYHRNSMARHSLNMHGFGIVQGLVVDIQHRKKSYYAVIDAGYGITQTGQGVQLSESKACKLELPPRDGVVRELSLEDVWAGRQAFEEVALAGHAAGESDLEAPLRSGGRSAT